MRRSVTIPLFASLGASLLLAACTPQDSPLAETPPRLKGNQVAATGRADQIALGGHGEFFDADMRRIVLTEGGFDAPSSATAQVCIVPVQGGVPGAQRVLIRANRSGALTARERAVAEHYATGLSYKEIAKVLGISPDTVRSYIKCCYAKLAVGNKMQLQAALGGRD